MTKDPSAFRFTFLLSVEEARELHSLLLALGSTEGPAKRLKEHLHAAIESYDAPDLTLEAEGEY